MKRAFVGGMEGGGHVISIREAAAPCHLSTREVPQTDGTMPLPEIHWSVGKRVLLPGGGVGVVQRVDEDNAYATASMEAEEVPIPKHLLRRVTE